MKKIQAYFEPDNPALTDNDEAFQRLIGGYMGLINQINNEENTAGERCHMAELLNGYEAALYSVGWKVTRELVPEEDLQE
jgi:hypothetical protein